MYMIPLGNTWPRCGLDSIGMWPGDSLSALRILISMRMVGVQSKVLKKTTTLLQVNCIFISDVSDCATKELKTQWTTISMLLM